MIDKMIDRWCTQIYYEESAHVIMEAGKPHSLLSAVWGPRIADGVWVWRSANQEHWWCNSPSEGRRRLIPTQTVRQRGRSFPFSMVLLHSGPQRTGWGPPTLGREICFTQSNLIWKQTHPEMMFTNIWASCDSDTLTYKISHHCVSRSPLSLTSPCLSVFHRTACRPGSWEDSGSLVLYWRHSSWVYAT